MTACVPADPCSYAPPIRAVLRSQWSAPPALVDVSDETDDGGGVGVTAGRVRSGALDYRSHERLEMLEALRQVAAGGYDDDTPTGSAVQPGTADWLALHAESAAGAHRATGWQRAGRSQVEVEASRARGLVGASSGGATNGGAGLDWASWEDRWAEQLRGFASSASRPHQPRSPPPPPPPPRPRTAPRRHSSPQSSQHSTPRASHRGHAPHSAPPRPAASRGGPSPRSPPPPPPKRNKAGSSTSSSSSPPPHGSQRPPQRASASAQRQGGVGVPYSSWSAFDAAFEAFETNVANVPDNLPSVRLSDVPMPPADDPAGLREAGLLRGATSADGAAKRKKLLRKGLLRWHPDKWAAVLAKVRPVDQAALAEQLGAVTQALLRQKDAA